MKKMATGRTLSMPAGLAVGAAVSLGITLAGAAILAWLIDKERLDMGSVGYGILAVLLLASFLGALVSFGKIRRRRMVVCLASGAVYLGMLLSITALFFGGQYSGVATTALLILGGSMAAALLGLGPGRGGRGRKIKLPVS